MQEHYPFADWQSVLDAPRSAFFRGHASDTVRDRAALGMRFPSSESLFTQANARVLIGHAANGMFRLIALPTQVYPAPAGTQELGLGPGMFHHFDVAMYAGNLSYQITLEDGDTPIDLAGDDRDNETTYADDFLPLTRTRCGELDVTIVSLAPVAPDARSAPLAPAPLPGPGGALYVLRLHNKGASAVQGTVALQAGDMLLGHYEDANLATEEFKRPDLDLRQQTLILTRPQGSVGIHLHDGRWVRTEPPYRAEHTLSLAPGEEVVIETHLAMGSTYSEVMPVIYGLHMRSALDWLNLTAAFWRSRLGRLSVDADESSEEARVSRDVYVRCLLDNFNCLQTDAEGTLISHWQGAPSHGYGTIWGIDVEPTAVSIVHMCPELTRRALEFFMARSRVPKGPADHSVPILVAPVIIARQWLQVTDDTAFLEQRQEVMAALQGIMDHLEALKAPSETLFPSRYSSDGPVGRRYDYGTNVKVWYAFDSYAYLLQRLGTLEAAAHYSEIARQIQAAIERTMVVAGPFGRQVSGGTNLGEEPGTFYLPEGVPYYDGEDTSSMLAPVYGICDYSHEPWINYHRFARSLWCANYDPEFDTLRWSPGESGVFDGTALLSRVGGSVAPGEMREALETLRAVGVDDVTGSVFWWPHGVEHKRGLTRCSQGQGAWAWQYLQQWLGLQVDTPRHTLTVAPRGMLTRVDWEGFAAGAQRFDIHWAESEHGAVLTVSNCNCESWAIQVGFRQPGTAAQGGLAWQTRQLAPGETAALAHQAAAETRVEMVQSAVAALEVAALGDPDGVLLSRFGPATLWGHWDIDQQWNPQAMPLALRMVVLNGTTMDWTAASVELRYPDGWLGQGRGPRHWARPVNLAPKAARVELGPLPRMARTVAAFWVKGPHVHNIVKAWEPTTMPFHAPSQPGNGLTVPSLDVAEREELTFEAELQAQADDGSPIRKRLRIPVWIVPG